MRQIAKVLTVALFVSTVWMSPAHAASAWYKCEVDMAWMPDGNIVFMRITHLADTPAFTNKAFLATSENAKAIFAAALTAMSTKLPVWIFAYPDVSIPPFSFIYLAKD